MEIIRTIGPKEDAASALATTIRNANAQQILLMVSGGSAFSILNLIPSDALGSHITLCVLDERFSVDEMVNNFAQLQQTDFFKRCIDSGVSVISTIVAPNDSLEAFAVRMDSRLREWKMQNPNGSVIATMGIGPDGHTAGIFPGSYSVNFSGDEWVVGYSVSKEVNQYTERITVTHTFLQEVVDDAIVYAVGNDKQTHINALEQAVCNPEKMPACVLLNMKSVSLYTGVPEGV